MTSTIIIRSPHTEEAFAVRRLAYLDSQRPLRGQTLVAFEDGQPLAAISLADGRVVADPFQQTAKLVAQLRMRARAMQEAERTPDLSDRLRESVPFAMRVAPGYWF